jgi:predicted short-subunit dehydrogenase-like oxidoreductase (DUF2520 family)
LTDTASLLSGVWVVGPGRLGMAFVRQLTSLNPRGRLSLLGRSIRPSDGLDLGEGRLARHTWEDPPRQAPTLVLITVPDGAIPEVGARLPAIVPRDVPVLHTSGVLGSDRLGERLKAGNAVGSIHPLVAVTRSPESAARLVGAWYGVEGTDSGLDAAEALARVMKGRSFRVEASQKPLYHAAAVFASNYVVTLLAIAQRLMQKAGAEDGAIGALCELARGAVAGVDSVGLPDALTGPVARGDADTLMLHLLRLSVEERSLYSGLAREALALARGQGLDDAAAQRVLQTLEAGIV